MRIWSYSLQNVVIVRENIVTSKQQKLPFSGSIELLQHIKPEEIGRVMGNLLSKQ